LNFATDWERNSLIRAWYAAAGLHYVAYRTGVIPYGSEMLANFYGAVCARVVCFLVTSIASLRTRRRNSAELAGLVYSWTLAGHPA
jgi:SSS family solute:Na+ symporter